MNPEHKQISKFLSWVLRHKPEAIGLNLDESGWVNTEELLEKSRQRDFDLTLEQLEIIVASNDKKRFSFSEDRTKIRANQGHSIRVNLGIPEKEPPTLLFHGTARRNLPSIREKGLQRQQRHHVHLSADEATARSVGQRHGKPVVLKVQAGRMHAAGISFYLSENGVWLTEAIAVDFIDFPETT